MATTQRIRKSSSSSYKLKIVDEDSLEEVFSTKLSRSRFYIFISTLFVTSVIITVSILFFTPLKYYIPGYGSNKAQKELVHLRMQLDTLNVMIKEQERFNKTVRSIITGDFKGVKDTTLLDIKRVTNEDMNSIMPKAEDVKKDAAKELKLEAKRNGAKR
ncbi:MAG TPA: hypothetical protein VL098_03580 [Flavipsychrobacter sp.]|nr:hypothetical protein [Flavipsychrobacter sp.]